MLSPQLALPEMIRQLWAELNAAILFYTVLPLPQRWPTQFAGMSRWAPIVGVMLGLILTVSDRLLAVAQLPLPLRSLLIVLLAIALTGGLHLDGAMDTADGLAVPNPDRRLEVMSDSRTGAFGAIAAIAIISLKTLALCYLPAPRSLLILLIPVWGRWAQVLAIVRYPYLKAEGKGAIHKQTGRGAIDLLPGAIALLIGISAIARLQSLTVALQLLAIGLFWTWTTGAWLQKKLGGQTGDTYGAIVEWTEALIWVSLTIGQA